MKKHVRTLAQRLSLILLAPLFTVVNAQVNDVQLYTFAHSLIDHPSASAPNNETTILYWIYDIAQTSGKTFATTGQFGQLPYYVDNLPPNSSLGYQTVPRSWDDSQTTFANSNINTILSTAANFVQWVPPSDPDPSDPQGRTTIANTETLFDWTNTQKSNMRYYIYGNWPEMTNLQNNYPPTVPTQSEIDNFHNTTIGTTGDFAQWWINYQDAIVASRPLLNTRLIPVGMVISKILTDTSVIPTQIPFNELYEDSDPHGRANIYFLAGMITYMALYEENIPPSYMPSNIISPLIRNNLAAIRNFAWQELYDFNFSNGDSRVFYNRPSSNPVEFISFNAKSEDSKIQLTWQTATEQNNEKFEIEMSLNGRDFQTIGEVKGNGTTATQQNYSFAVKSPQGGISYYRLKQIDFEGTFKYSEVKSVNFKKNNKQIEEFYPNPSSSGFTHFNYVAQNNGKITISVFDMTGKLMIHQAQQVLKGENNLSFDFSDLNTGNYIVKIDDKRNLLYKKLIIEK